MNEKLDSKVIFDPFKKEQKVEKKEFLICNISTNCQSCYFFPEN